MNVDRIVLAKFLAHLKGFLSRFDDDVICGATPSALVIQSGDVITLRAVPTRQRFDKEVDEMPLLPHREDGKDGTNAEWTRSDTVKGVCFQMECDGATTTGLPLLDEIAASTDKR